MVTRQSLSTEDETAAASSLGWESDAGFDSPSRMETDRPSVRSINVELVEFGDGDPASGLGRYSSAVRDALCADSSTVDARIRRFHSLPGAGRIHSLRHFPLGIDQRRPSSIVHLLQIMGSALLQYRSIHPSVVTVHDLGILAAPHDNELFTPLGRQLMMMQFYGLRHADWLVADSQYTRDTLVRTLGIAPERIRVVYPGVDHANLAGGTEPDLTELVRYRPPRERGAFDLLYVGSELPRKNLVGLLKALAVLKARGERVRLIKAGGAGGERWREVTRRHIVSLGLEGDVIFTGRVDEAHLPLLYRDADAFVTASLLEGFGLPAAEAMASGTPVICSNFGSLPEIVGDAGLCIDPHSPDEIAAAVVQVRDNAALRAGMAEAGIRQAARYTWAKTAAGLNDLYTEITRTQTARTTR